MSARRYFVFVIVHYVFSTQHFFGEEYQADRDAIPHSYDNEADATSEQPKAISEQMLHGNSRSEKHGGVVMVRSMGIQDKKTETPCESVSALILNIFENCEHLSRP